MLKPLFLIIFLSVLAVPQEKKGTLYSSGLKACLEKEVEAYSKFSNRDLHNVIVVRDDKITRDLPPQLGEIKVKYLDNTELAKRFIALPKTDKNKGLPVIEIFPLYDKDDKLFFAYNNYWFRYLQSGGLFSQKKIAYSFGLEGGCHAEIRFDSTNRKFVIDKVELWGV